MMNKELFEKYDAVLEWAFKANDECLDMWDFCPTYYDRKLQDAFNAACKALEDLQALLIEREKEC